MCRGRSAAADRNNDRDLVDQRGIDECLSGDFFDDLDRPFSVRSFAIGSSGDLSLGEEPLVVHAVGAFDASFVPRRKDFARLDKRFRIFGSHHQKLLAIKAGAQLIAYVGGIEYSTDRLFPSPPSPTVGSPLRLPALVELIKIDLERQWQLGKQPTIESYLAAFPELGGHDDVATRR